MTSATNRCPGRATLALLSALALTLTLIPPSPGSALEASTDVWINELHYDNVGTDEGEFIELAGVAGTDLTGWSVVLYNGSNGTAYDTDDLDGALADAGDGFGFELLTYPTNGIQNGAPDGIALIDDLDEVVQLLSYEGTFTAVGGPADGLTSTDIGIAQAGDEPVGSSLHLTGEGSTYLDFSWTATTESTPGAVNGGQTLTGSGDPSDGGGDPGDDDQDPGAGTGTAWINEFHYDNVGTDVGEFVEIAFTAGLDVSGYRLVLYNGNGGAPYNTTSLADATLTGSQESVDFAVLEISGIQNGAPDGLALIDADGGVVEFLSYEGTFTAVGGPAGGLTSTDVGVEQTSSTPAGASLQLQGTGSVAADYTWAALDVDTKGGPNLDQTIGDLVGPSAPTVPDADVCEVLDEDITRIHTIQGDGGTSSFTGDPVFSPGPEVTIRAVATLTSAELGGFFVQEAPENEDSDPATSEGLFIDGSIPDGLEVGDTVAVGGGVLENFDRTQLEATAVDVCDDAPTVIEPVALPLPSSAEERESFENMLVTASDLVVSGSFAAFRFGELITGHQGELPSATEVAAPGPEAEAALEDIKEREVILNDRFGSSFSRNVWDEDPERRLGDRIDEVTGVLDYTFSNFKIQYTEFPTFELFGAPEVPRLDEGNDIGAFNVLNYFDEFGDSSRLRGARDQAQFDLQTAKIVDTILELDATVLGLVELQNDYLDEFDDDPDTVPSVATLVNALNEEAGQDRYDWVRMPEELLATEGLNGGGVGTDAIANGIIYQPERATQVGEASTFDIDNGLSGDGDKNRWPFAASFDIDGQLATVAVNHFKSKGSGCEAVIGPDFAAGEDDGSTLAGNCDLTRQYAANELVEWIDTDPTGAGTDNVFLVGDFNSYAREAPIEVMKDAGYLNMVEELADGAFTYKFSGRVGTLDYIMASGPAAAIVDDAAVWQTNSRASYVDLYYIADDTTVDSGNLPKGASDHDPLVVSLLAAADEPGQTAPTDGDECKDGGWRSFTDPRFRNQGQCVSFVASGELRVPPAAAGRSNPGRR